MYVSKPLPLEGTRNTRDLGGYQTKSGMLTADHVFLRSDGIHNLSQTDQLYLEEYGVSSIIDLRAPFEVEKDPDPLMKGVQYYNFSLLDQMNSNGFKGKPPESMAEMYIGFMKEENPVLVDILRQIAKLDSCVLFHCTAGKDRTGVLAAILLSLAGVLEELIIEDYAVTEHNMRDMAEKQKRMLTVSGRVLPDYIFESRPETMEETLLHLKKEYGSARSFLEAKGLSERDLNCLAGKLLHSSKNDL